MSKKNKNKPATGRHVPVVGEALAAYVASETRKAKRRGRYKDGDETMFAAEFNRMLSRVYEAGTGAEEDDDNPYEG